MTGQLGPSFTGNKGTNRFMTRVTISEKVVIWCSFCDATLNNSALAPVILVLVPHMRRQNDRAISGLILRYRRSPRLAIWASRPIKRVLLCNLHGVTTT